MADLIVPILCGILTGTLIGTVGVGGILLAPLLVYVAGMDLHMAMATCSWCFLFTGISGSYAYIKKKSVSWPMIIGLSIGVVPGAVLGAMTNTALKEETLMLILATLIGLSGVNSLIPKKKVKDPRESLPKPLLIVLGFVLGFGSALTGTGGPVLLLPIFLFLRVPVLISLGVAQVVQLPIAVFATAGFLKNGNVDFELGTILGFVQAVAVLGGAKLAHALPKSTLQKVVSVALVGASIFYFMKMFKVF